MPAAARSCRAAVLLYQHRPGGAGWFVLVHDAEPARDRARRPGPEERVEHHIARHHADIEAIYTFEGTDHVQALIVGRDITGISAITGRRSSRAQEKPAEPQQSI